MCHSKRKQKKNQLTKEQNDQVCIKNGEQLTFCVSGIVISCASSKWPSHGKGEYLLEAALRQWSTGEEHKAGDVRTGMKQTTTHLSILLSRMDTRQQGEKSSGVRAVKVRAVKQQCTRHFAAHNVPRTSSFQIRPTIWININFLHQMPYHITLGTCKLSKVNHSSSRFIIKKNKLASIPKPVYDYPFVKMWYK